MTAHPFDKMLDALDGEPARVSPVNTLGGEAIGTAGNVSPHDFRHWPPHPPRSIAEFAPLVETLEPLPPDERARVLLYCLLKYVPDEFSNGELFGLLELARNPATARPPGT